jgi:hypothetical protein
VPIHRQTKFIFAAIDNGSGWLRNVIITMSRRVYRLADEDFYQDSETRLATPLRKGHRRQDLAGRHGNWAPPEKSGTSGSLAPSAAMNADKPDGRGPVSSRLTFAGTTFTGRDSCDSVEHPAWMSLNADAAQNNDLSHWD